MRPLSTFVAACAARAARPYPDLTSPPRRGGTSDHHRKGEPSWPCTGSGNLPGVFP
ncbi:exported hypothetical protein [Cupriavidus taiwanensis]|nr:exported hypothetical protein [Cupriavidus taiwanensis]